MYLPILWFLFLQLCFALTVPKKPSSDVIKPAVDPAKSLERKSYRSRYWSCTACCAGLSTLFPGKVKYFNDTVYAEQQQSYWSQQQQQTYPVCRFTPAEAREVSAAIHLVRATQCRFAVKSGGHASFEGGSNIQNGLAIDLSGLSALKLSNDSSILCVGPGNRWEDVYAFLDPLDLSVVGGRNGDVGVGGLTLGGGISYFSGFYGWALDNVANYEVIIANGSIVNASLTSHPDLYFALRGGGNNFGIITRFDFETFPHGDMWGGQIFYPFSTNQSQFEAFYWWAENANLDANGALILAAASVPGYGSFFSNGFVYAWPVMSPPLFDNFTAITNFSSTARLTRLPDLVAELTGSQPPGFRQVYITATFKNDIQMMSDIFKIWNDAVQPIFEDIAGFVPALAFQPITAKIIENFSKNGGNALGISPEDGSLTLWNMDFQWSDRRNDSIVLDMIQNIIAEGNAVAKSCGLFHRYIYQNYAYITQDVFAGYGEENKARLLRI
ncbi:hypothetical protein W97_07999 [Coniosporium apollinis CBS 100218]|uniref:FAD-binding PCMH-type domain-containing protein n=1 Tax=Coniosporium apollinis (strain CBS 100218) TaxID=1168221 RepID=R7Z492_CONA1|nr:uncharacterized protein W97_07999 [Coniosporium apollinis CBS 100218]EON68741.1 hypothetical protein W97_07999 [Coniosporium apollinis CBS 100218]